MQLSKLTQIGLTENQARVYLKLYKSPNISVGDLSKKLSIDRSFLYNVLEALSKKGLVSYSILKNKKVFRVTRPENLLKSLEEKQQLTRELVEELKSLEEEEKNWMEIHDGKAGLKIYAREMIGAKKTLTLGGGGKLKILEHLKYEIPHFFQKMQKKGTGSKMITSLENKTLWIESMKSSKIEIRGLPEGKSESSVTVADDKVIISTETDDPKVIIFRDSELVRFFTNYFEILWNVAM
jgi:sugar-specific transcriptional regulator TrmB